MFITQKAKTEYYQNLRFINKSVRFTPRELDIAACIVNARTAHKEITKILGINNHKVVQNHIGYMKRMLNKGSSSGTTQDLRDFIEKSDKFYLIKEHYNYLQRKCIFDDTLKEISKISDKESNMISIYFIDDEESNFLLGDQENMMLNAHLNLAGFKVTSKSIKDIGNMQTNPLNVGENIIFIISDNFIENFNKNKKTKEIFDKLSKDWVSNKENGKNIIFLTVTDAQLSSNIIDLFPSFKHVSFKDNYYLSFFDLLQSLNGSHISDIKNLITKFKDDYENPLKYFNNNIVGINNLQDTLGVVEQQLIAQSDKRQSNLTIVTNKLLLNKNTLLLWLGLIFLLAYIIKMYIDYYDRPLHNLSQRNNNFVGRKEIIKSIDTQLSATKNVILSGMPGIGKTQIAKEYAYIYSKNYDIIWWFDGNKPMQIQLLDLYNMLIRKKYILDDGLDRSKINVEKLYQELINTLQAINKKVLLILDNVIDKTKTKFLFDQSQFEKVNIIITTYLNINSDNKLIVNELNTSEAEELIRHFSLNYSKDEIEKLYNTLGKYPLQISQTCAFLKTHPNLLLSNYLQIFFETPHTIWDNEEGFFAKEFVNWYEYSGTLSQSFRIIIENIKKENLNAYKMLVIISFLSANNISEYYLKLVNTQLLSSNELDYTNIIYLLKKYNILELDTSNSTFSKKEPIYIIHELLQKYIEANIAEEERKHHLDEALTIVAKPFIEEPFINALHISKNPHFLYNARKIIETAIKYNISNETLLKLKIRYFQFEISMSLESFPLTLLIKEIDKDLSKVHIEQIYKSIYFNSKSVYYALVLYDNKKALESALKLFNSTEDISNTQNEYIRLVTNICHYYLSLGDIKNAKKFIQLSNDKLGYEREINNYSKLLHYYAAIRYYIDIEQYNTALEYANKAEQILAALNTQQGFVMKFFIKSFKSVVLYRLKRYSESSSLSDSTLQEAKKSFKEIPLDISSTLELTRLQNLLQLDKKIDKEEVIKIIQFFKSKCTLHRDLAEFHILLGNILAKQKNIKEAQTEYMLAQKILDELGFDKNHSLYNELLQLQEISF